MQRGFSLVFVTMLIALISISALVVLNLVSDDQTLLGWERAAREARDTAEGGTMEAINDHRFTASLPDPDASDLTDAYTPDSGSQFSGGHRDYALNVRLLRTTQVVESSHAHVRALVYGLDVSAKAGLEGQARAEAQVYRIVSAKPGTVVGKRHAR